MSRHRFQGSHAELVNGPLEVDNCIFFRHKINPERPMRHLCAGVVVPKSLRNTIFAAFNTSPTRMAGQPHRLHQDIELENRNTVILARHGKQYKKTHTGMCTRLQSNKFSKPWSTTTTEDIWGWWCTIWRYCIKCSMAPRQSSPNQRSGGFTHSDLFRCHDRICRSNVFKNYHTIPSITTKVPKGGFWHNHVCMRMPNCVSHTVRG